MSESLQIGDMDAKQIAERQIIVQYLSGRLSEEDAQAFEAYVEAHPEMIREIETIARMKSGLVTLKRRGELAALISPAGPAWYRRPVIVAALAASVAAVAFFFARPVNVDGPVVLASTLQQLGGDRARLPAVSSRISLSRTRSIVSQEISPQPSGSAIEVTLHTGLLDATASSAVSLLRVTGDSVDPVAVAKDLHANTDGDLAVFVYAETLAEGAYLFRVTTEGRDPQDFGIRITRAAD